MKVIPNNLWSFLTLAIFLQGCTPDYDQAAIGRSQHAQANKGDIVIVGIEEPEPSSDYIKGIQLAVEEINERPNKLLGRKLRLIVEQGGADFESILPTLQRIAVDPQVTAVLGHRKSTNAVPASVIYEKSQIVFLPPFATAKGLTNHSFRFVFRMIPNNLVLAEQLASVAKVLGYKKIISLYDYSDYNREVAFAFEDAALTQKIELVFRSSFSSTEEDYRSLISRFQNEDFDAIFLSTDNEPGVRMVKQIREMGLEVPVLSGDGLKPKRFKKGAGLSGDNTMIPMVYRPQNSSKLNQHFRSRFKKMYQAEADYNAAEGYDSVMLLAAAIDKAHSTVPSNLSSTLRYLPFWSGVTGLHAFNSEGELLGKHYYFQVLSNGEWYIVPDINKPYNLERFQRYKHLSDPKATIEDYRHVLAKRLHPIDFRRTTFHLLQEALEFKHLGWIYDETDEKQSAVESRWLHYLGRTKQFTVDKCGIAFSSLNPVEIRQELIRCYGTLGSDVEVIYITESPAMNPVLMKRLNRTLKAYEVPTIAFRSDHKSLDMGITIELDRADLQINSAQSIAIFNGLLTKLKGFELADTLANMPIFIADLKSLSDYGFMDSKDLIMLSPELSEE